MRIKERGLALLAVVAVLVVALGIRVASHTSVLDSSGALAQYSGTALYAAMVYAGVFVLSPGRRPPAAGALALAFCWAVEFFQLTGVPAELSARSVLARLALGVAFDAGDLLWYAAGIVPPVLLHAAVRRRLRQLRARPASQSSSTAAS
ncbi:ribosomal maturation YjgA family protein [Actinoplanes sp. RD1]|uniref:ribosomal maturation YjgA family protein n=1 Tax=Actinoplanes sp. RD1 TaxID=3064538 RepID=UPI0027417A6E|nr:DUF2809 domain-containing protein [Actinoplanes sp. RD1]